ncbi:MAG: TRAP transporter small permease [Cyanobium sp.]|nr:TRAP transporter small permease [Burkholderiales bacterium]
MTALRWMYRGIDAAASLIVVAVVLSLLGLVALQFLDRYVAHRWQGFPADEYIKVGIVWLCFVGFGLAVRGGLEIRVDYLDQHLPTGLRRWLFGAFDIVTLALISVILFKGMRLYEVSSLQMILGTDMTVAVPVLGMMLGCALLFLAVFARLLKRVTGMEL